MRGIMTVYVLTLILTAFAVSPTQAACSCQCVNGEMQALCSSQYDIEPICPPRVCAITPPSVAPIQRPVVPPLGTSGCYQAQVQNQYTGRYEWREVCR
jgi:hypothetical protein